MLAEENGDAKEGALEGGDYYSAAQVAKKLGYTTRHITELCRNGRFGAFQLGRRWLIPRIEVDQLSAKGLEPPAPTVQVTVMQQVRGPFQERAYAMHLKGDHSYLEDDQYEGHVFITETIDGPNFWEGWEVLPGARRYSVKPDSINAKAIRVPIQRQRRKCLWCKVFMWTEPGSTPETPLELEESIYGRPTIKWTQSEDPA